MEKREPITAEDIALVKRYLIVPMILDAFERDKQIIESGLFKAMDQATKKLTYVRRAFKEHGIKVYDERKTRKGVEAKYLCRGYHSKVTALSSRPRVSNSISRLQDWQTYRPRK